MKHVEMEHVGTSVGSPLWWGWGLAEWSAWAVPGEGARRAEV